MSDEKIRALHEQVEGLKKELAVAEAFHRVAIAERDAERRRVLMLEEKLDTKNLLLTAFLAGIEAHPYDRPDYDNESMDCSFLNGQEHREKHIGKNSPPVNTQRKDLYRD